MVVFEVVVLAGAVLEEEDSEGVPQLSEWVDPDLVEHHLGELELIE